MAESEMMEDYDEIKLMAFPMAILTLPQDDDASQQDQMSPPHGRHFDGRRIYRVPLQLMRMNKGNYAPRMVSFGPYNHGQPELVEAEKFKVRVVEMFISQTDKSRDELFDKVFQVIHEIRLCYDGVSDQRAFNDAKLAEIMLRDTIFVIYLMQKAMRESELNINADKFLLAVGSTALPFLYTDMLLLDNQIPLSIVNLFISLIYVNKQEEDKEDGSSFVLRYILEGLLLLDHNKIKSFPTKDGKQPLHLLDAIWRLKAEEYSNSTQMQVQVQVEPPVVHRHINRPFCSVSELKAKGVHFNPIDSRCVRHIRFDSWRIFGKLQLPIFSVDESAKVIYSNLIAYEINLGSTNQRVITSYINFMKSLIVTSKDVKVLREKGILINTYDSDEHVIKQFKGIDTYGLDEPSIFSAVKNKIEDHCKHKVGSWMAELIYTYFRSPWTFIALLATAFLLCLATIQTYYTVNPPS